MNPRDPASYALRYCVLHKDVEQGDEFVNGPFVTEAEARLFALDLGNSYGQAAQDEGDKLHLDTEDPSFLQLRTWDDAEIVREFIVLELISPI